MSLDTFKPFIDTLHATIVGLRTAQTGKTNHHLARLTRLLMSLIECMPAESRAPAPLLLKRMLKAKERGDNTSLADLFQYELPIFFAKTHIPASMFEPTIVGEIEKLCNYFGETDVYPTPGPLTTKSQEAQKLLNATKPYCAALLLSSKDYSGVLRILGSNHNSETNLPIANYIRACALAETRQYSEAISAMTIAYNQCPTLRNGFSRIAWASSKHDKHQIALAIVERDILLQRITPHWQKNAALLYAENGELTRAETIIQNAYTTAPDLRDAYAGIAEICISKERWERARYYFERDLTLDRLTATRRLIYSICLTRLGEVDVAASTVADAYAQDANLSDGYSRLGWYRYLYFNQVGALHEGIDKDQQLNRCSTKQKLFQILLNLIHGNSFEVEEISDAVHHVYTEFNDQRNWLSAIGWLLILKGDHSNGCSLMAKDLEWCRMDNWWLPSFVVALALNGRKADAKRNLSAVMDTGLRTALPLGYQYATTASLTLTELAQLVDDDRNLTSLLDRSSQSA